MACKVGFKVFLMGLLILSGSLASAQSPEKVFSLFIYNFAQNLKFPDNGSTGDFVIGVLGNSTIADELNKIVSNKKLGTRKILVKEYKLGLAEYDCDLLFFYDPKNSAVPEISQRLKSTGVFIVSKDGYAKDTGGIDLFIDNGKLKFKINQKAIEAKGIKIASSLLTLGVVV